MFLTERVEDAPIPVSRASEEVITDVPGNSYLLFVVYHKNLNRRPQTQTAFNTSLLVAAGCFSPYVQTSGSSTARGRLGPRTAVVPIAFCAP